MKQAMRQTNNTNINTYSYVCKVLVNMHTTLMSILVLKLKRIINMFTVVVPLLTILSFNSMLLL